MEIKENKIKKDEKIKDLNEQELIIYKYLTEYNSPKIKLDIENQISEIKKQKDLIPKIEEKEQNLADNLINNYFEEKESKNKNTEDKNSKRVFNIDNFINEKEIIEKKIKDKNEAIELLKTLNNSIKSKIISQKLIEKINSNNYLCRNKDLKDYISKINKNKINFEKEELTDEQKIICSFRNIIKNSFEEAKSNIVEEKTILKLFQDLKFENIDIQQIIKEYEGNTDNENNCKDEKINEFKSNINITPSFDLFLKQLHKYNPFNNNHKNNYYIFYKIINLLISRYNSYYSKIDERKEKKATLILCHNNLELFINLINFYILFYNNNNKNEQLKESINKSLINIVIKVKNLSISMFSEVMANFNKELIEEMEEIETFENVRKPNKNNDCLKKIQKTIKMIFTFFDELRVTSIHREIIFYFNNVLSIYFNSLNRKILQVSSYDLEDIQTLLNLSQEILKNMKKNIEKMSSQNMNLSVKFMNILEQNMEYLKFQEILFILNANLKQIKNYLIKENFTIYIRKEEFLSLLNSTFDQSEKLSEIIHLINEKVKEKI